MGLGGEGEGLERSGVGEGKKIGMLRRGRGREEGGVEFLKWETKWDIHFHLIFFLMGCYWESTSGWGLIRRVRWHVGSGEKG